MKLTTYRFELGIVMAMFATPLAVVTKEILGMDNSIITFLYYIVSVMLIMDWNFLFKGKIYGFSYSMIAILLLQIYIVISAFFSDENILSLSSPKSIIYTIYVIAFLIAIKTNNKIIDQSAFLNIAITVTGILNICTFFLIVTGLTDAMRISVTTLDNGTDRVTLAGAPYAYIISFMCYKSKNKSEKILMIGVLLLSLFNLFACNRRTVYISILICIGIYIIKKAQKLPTINSRKLFRGIFTIAVVLFLAYLLLSVPWIRNLVNTSVDSLKNGLNTFIGKTDSFDASVMIRNRNRAKTLEYLKENSFIQWVFGRGYGFLWIDNPVLEAYLDLGVIMGSIYLIMGVILPIVFILKRDLGAAEMLVAFYAISVVASNFSSGMPYGHNKYCALIIFIFLIVERHCSVITDNNRLTEQ